MAVFISKGWEWVLPGVDPYARRYYVYDQSRHLLAESQWGSAWEKPV